jgi:cobalt-zinc-cadmium efflux system membrane fusion protein
VLRVLANVGDQVRKGQPLFEIDASELVQGQNDLVTAVNALNTAQSQLRLVQTNEQRKQALYDAKAGSLQDWQQSQADVVSAANTLRSAETALATARNRLHILGKSDSEIEAMQTRGKLDPATAVVAPIAGTVTDRQLGPGQFLQAGSNAPVFSIGDLSTVWLVGNVRETDAPSMRRGQEVEVRVLALGDRIFRARVTSIAPSVDPNTRRVAVRAEMLNPDGALKPEMFATFSIVTDEGGSAPGVPAVAVLAEGDTARVWVEHDGMLQAREIRVGRTHAGMVEVLAGLAPGERVVTSGALFLDRAVRAD